MGKTSAQRPSLGGAADEAGGAYRAGVAAVIAAHLLYGWDLTHLDLPKGEAVPGTLRLEADGPVDDIVVALSGGGQAFLQAKRALKLKTTSGSQLAKAMSQCRNAVIESELNPQVDRLVIVSGSMSGPMRDLGEALRRQRDPFSGAMSKAQATALERFEPLLDGLDQTQRARLLDCLRIWNCDAEEQGGGDAERAAALLDGTIVSHGLGPRAFRALATKAREIARLRSGLDADRLIDCLREADVELTEDASGARGARIVARQQAVARYRQRLQISGDSIRLLGVGAGLPNLPIADIDASIEATEPWLEEDRPSEQPLDLLVRRRGRLLLTGLPGAGKSTALRRAAAIQAGEAHSPLPIIVRLDVLARRLEHSGFTDAVIELASEDAPPADRDLLREELRQAIAGGRATFFFDALDEARGRSRAVIDAIMTFLDGVDPSVEVVLATRDTKADDAAALGFRQARLCEPERLGQTIEGILRAFALHRKIVNPKEWVQPRQRWVDRVLSRDPDLKSTPLMPILLAVSAAQADDSGLPEVRPEILRRVIRDVVFEWETGRTHEGVLELGKITGTRATEALLECFIAEGVTLAAELRPSEERVATVLAAGLEEKWNLAPGEARATAREAIAFWDESGVFLKSSQGEVEPRVKLFSELADAWHHSSAEDERPRAWARKALADGERDEALKLAACLSEVVAEELIRASTRGGRARDVFLALETIKQGAQVGDTAIDEVAEGLIELVAGGGQTGIEAAGELVALDVPEHLRDRGLECIQRYLPRDRALLAEVRATVNWGLPRDDAAMARFEEVLRSDPPKPLPSEEPRDIRARLQLSGVDGQWSAAVAAAAEVLVPLSKNNAALAAKQVEKLGMRSAQRIVDVVQAAGHGNLVAHYEKQVKRSLKQADFWVKSVARSREANHLFLEMISKCGGESELSTREQRGLDELVDFYFTLGIPDSAAFSFAEMTLAHPVRVRELVQAAVVLGGFDADKLASEARLLQRETKAHERSSLSQIIYMPGVDRELSRWGQVGEPDPMVDDLIRHLGGVRFSARRAAAALAAAPKSLGVHGKVLSKLDRMRGWHLQQGGLLALETASNNGTALELAAEWSKEGKAPLRRMAGQFAAVAIPTLPEARSLFVLSLADRDSGVRAEAVDSFDAANLDRKLRGAIEAARNGATEWECNWCTHQNPQPAGSCEQCQSVGPELSQKIDALLRAESTR
jgi:hypothetical protein